MARDHRFRFAAQIAKAESGRQWAEKARKVEDLGYSTLTMPDHFGDQLAPVPAMMAAADATTTLRIGTLVFANDYRHPRLLAREAAALDLLSGGRLELGLGAGWMRTDYEQSGIAYDPPAARVGRLEEALAVLKTVLGDGRRPPIVIGGGARRMLSIAAREADIVGVNPDLREGLGGPETAPNITPAKTSEKIAWIRQAAGGRFEEIELNVLVGFCLVTDDPGSVAEAMAPAFGIAPDDALHVPHALVGPLEWMIDELQRRRDEWGFSYVGFDGDSWEAMAPVVARLAGT